MKPQSSPATVYIGTALLGWFYFSIAWVAVDVSLVPDEPPFVRMMMLCFFSLAMAWWLGRQRQQLFGENRDINERVAWLLIAVNGAVTGGWFWPIFSADFQFPATLKLVAGLCVLFVMHSGFVYVLTTGLETESGAESTTPDTM